MAENLVKPGVDHELEGLENIKSNKKNLFFIIFSKGAGLHCF